MSAPRLGSFSGRVVAMFPFVSAFESKPRPMGGGVTESSLWTVPYSSFFPIMPVGKVPVGNHRERLEGGVKGVLSRRPSEGPRQPRN